MFIYDIFFNLRSYDAMSKYWMAAFLLNSRYGIEKRLSSYLTTIYSPVMNAQIVMWIYWGTSVWSKISSTFMTLKILGILRCPSSVPCLSRFPFHYSPRAFLDDVLQANPDYKGVCHIALAQEGHCRPGEVLSFLLFLVNYLFFRGWALVQQYDFSLRSNLKVMGSNCGNNLFACGVRLHTSNPLQTPQ